MKDFYIILNVFAIILFVLYKYMRRKLSYNEISTYLKECILCLGKDLKQSLIAKKEYKFNTMLLNYLYDDTKESLYSMAVYLKERHDISRYSSLTQAGVVMRALFREIIAEQLETNYNKGFTFSEKKFENISLKAPFLRKYCMIIRKKDGTYFTDILKCDAISTMQDIIKNGIYYHSYLYLHQKYNLDDLIFPENIVSLMNKRSQRYVIYFSNLGNFIVDLQDGNTYSINSMLMHKKNIIASNTFECIGGNKMEQENLDRIKSTFFKYSHSFLAVIVCKNYEASKKQSNADIKKA